VKRLLALLLICLVAGLTYAPALRDGFVWDDTALVLRDPILRSWRLIPEGFNHFLYNDATPSDFYRPVQRVGYTLVYWGAGFNAAAFHALSLLAHLAASLALFAFAENLLGALGVAPARARWIALIAALLWSIHPVNSAAVVYVAGLADPLAAAFGFSACALLLRSLQSPGRQAAVCQVLCGLAFLLSVLSKETGFVFLAIGLLLWLALGNRRKLWQLALVFAFVGALYVILRTGAEHFPTPPPRQSALILRPITVARAFAEYAGLIVLPINLHMDREVDASFAGPQGAVLNASAWRELQALAGVILIVAFIYWMLRARRRNRAEFLLLLCATIAYLPVSGVWLLNAAVAEHWLYLPLAFLLLAVAVALSDLAQNYLMARPARIVASALIATWAIFLAGRTFIRTFDWKDQRTFLERNIAAGGDSARMLINLGGLDLSEDRLEPARQHLQVALRKEPDQPLAVLNLATLALKQNDYKTARELLLRATNMPIVDARAHELLAVLDNKEKGQADLMRMRLAARTGPPDWSIEKRYIRLLDETGLTAQAIGEAEHCLGTDWYRADTWKLYAQLLQKAGKGDPAAIAMEKARAYDVHLDSATNAR
jgi:tetratricopeptide (TPR) repeat protein